MPTSNIPLESYSTHFGSSVGVTGDDTVPVEKREVTAVVCS